MIDIEEEARYLTRILNDIDDEISELERRETWLEIAVVILAVVTLGNVAALVLHN